MKILGTLLLLAAGLATVAGAQNCVFFSEYIEGTADNQALELYNPNNFDVDAVDLEVRIYFNGESEPGFVLPLAGHVLEGLNGLVIVHATGAPDLVRRGDIAVVGLDFDGNDAVELWSRAAGRQDLIGEVGVDSGTSWDGCMQDGGLQRHCRVRCGRTEDLLLASEPFGEWLKLPCDDWSGLGFHCDVVDSRSSSWGQVKALYR